MSACNIYTIGHSNHSSDAFLALLAVHQIEAIADVRSTPHSRFNPHFNREPLQSSLHAIGKHYVYLGEELGARRMEPECYVDGQAKYELIAQLPLFQTGLERIERGARQWRVALLCAEKDPLTCHRAILVARHLKTRGAAIQHILADGQLQSHAELEARLLRAVDSPGPDLLTTREEALEQAYLQQGARLAYVRPEARKKQ